MYTTSSLQIMSGALRLDPKDRIRAAIDCLEPLCWELTAAHLRERGDLSAAQQCRKRSSRTEASLTPLNFDCLRHVGDVNCMLSSACASNWRQDISTLIDRPFMRMTRRDRQRDCDEEDEDWKCFMCGRTEKLNDLTIDLYGPTSNVYRDLLSCSGRCTSDALISLSRRVVECTHAATTQQRVQDNVVQVCCGMTCQRLFMCMRAAVYIFPCIVQRAVHWLVCNQEQVSSLSPGWLSNDDNVEALNKLQNMLQFASSRKFTHYSRNLPNVDTPRKVWTNVDRIHSNRNITVAVLRKRFVDELCKSSVPKKKRRISCEDDDEHQAETSGSDDFIVEDDDQDEDEDDKEETQSQYDEESVYASDASDVGQCAVCDEVGELLICDACERLYHARCVGFEKEDVDALGDDWKCSYCVEKSNDKASDVSPPPEPTADDHASDTRNAEACALHPTNDVAATIRAFRSPSSKLLPSRASVAGALYQQIKRSIDEDRLSDARRDTCTLLTIQELAWLQNNRVLLDRD